MLLPLRSRFTSPPTLKKTRKITFQNLFPTEQTLRNEHSFSLKKNIYKISKIPFKSSNEMVTELSLSLSLKYNLNRFDPRKNAERSKERKKKSANKIPKRDDFLVSDRGNVQSNSKFPNNRGSPSRRGIRRKFPPRDHNSNRFWREEEGLRKKTLRT